MGWQDRPYSQPSGRSGNWGYRLLFGDFGVGQVFGIDIRIHCSLVILIALQLVAGLLRGPSGLMMAAISAAILFGIILLHEFGHCFAARSVGGRGDNVLLWPLGGLAYVSTPHRPWNNFVATAGGPAVNVVICLVCALAVKGMSGSLVPNLLAFLAPSTEVLERSGWTIAILEYIYSTSMALLLFNLLPILPLDGGSMLQSILWKFIGYYRALVTSAIVGMIGAVLVGVLNAGSIFMVLLMVSCFLYCAQVKNNAGAVADARYEESRYASSGQYEYGQRGAREGLRSVSFGGGSKPSRPKDDRITLRDINPLEWLAKKRRRKQFERLMRDD